MRGVANELGRRRERSEGEAVRRDRVAARNRGLRALAKRLRSRNG